jgi:hypothetical protein
MKTIPELYLNVSNGDVVTKECRESVMMLTKVLYALHIIDEEQAFQLATKFRILFV